MTLNQWFRKYIEYRRLTGLGEVGIRQMEDYYNWYIRDTPIGTRKLCHLDKLELLKHYKALQERKDHPLSYGTVKRVSNIVENALEEALAQRIITCNVAYKITKDIPEIIARKDREAVPEEDVRRFLEYAKNHRHYCYHYNVLVLLFGLGLRAGELCADRRRYERRSRSYLQIVAISRAGRKKRELYWYDQNRSRSAFPSISRLCEAGGGTAESL